MPYAHSPHPARAMAPRAACQHSPGSWQDKSSPLQLPASVSCQHQYLHDASCKDETYWLIGAVICGFLCGC